MRPRHARALLLLLLLAGAPGAARAQLSPGPLSAPHAELDAQTKCLQCHSRGGAGAMDQRCLDCHTEIAGMLTAKRGYHASKAKRDCAKCHPDHAGRDFQLVKWDAGSKEKFDHLETGYELKDAHAKLACEKCHAPKNQKSAVVKLIRKKDRAKSWLGLETNCESCHGDPHQGQLGKDCLQCHTFVDWSSAQKEFDHAKTKFPLTGKHAKVECAKCHAAAALGRPLDAKGQPVPLWKPLPHADCVNCHKDPHAGRFKGACASCHVTDDFHRIKSTGFNHDQTRYPLRGKHQGVACEKCHDEKTAWGPKPLFAKCTDCHKDAHNGQATLAGKPADCAACHDVSGFERSIYTLAQHQTTPYPLEGKHAAAACEKCHSKAPAGSKLAATLGTARVAMRPARAKCVDCHRDPHAGRFSPGGNRPHAKECLDCHTHDGFRPSGVDLTAHAKFAFALDGAHRATPCQSCHGELAAVPGARTLKADTAGARALKFEEPKRTCVACHGPQSPHGEQFAERKDKGVCESCHDGLAWKPASRFDHVKGASYKLEGAHLKVACADCHPSLTLPNGKSRVVYRPLGKRCEDCHKTTPREGDGAYAPSFPRPAGAFAASFAALAGTLHPLPLSVHEVTRAAIRI